MKRKFLGIPLLLIPILASGVSARPVDQAPTGLRPMLGVRPGNETPQLDSRRSSSLSLLPSTVFTDTISYGGTRWAADSLRWEALRDSQWTFDTGFGSALGPTGPNKPAGYHTRMEGWHGLDQTLSTLTYFRRSSTCPISGGFSFWAGVTLAEANSFCFAAGQGYGNNWALTIQKSYNYPGSGNVNLSYKYDVEAESGFDFTYSLIDTTGDGSADDLVLASYTGSTAGTESVTLVRGTLMRSTAGSFLLKFLVTSDGSYSDEDGLNPTVCGHTAIDDVVLSGAVVDNSTFEAGTNGWVQIIPTTAVGDYSNIVSRATDLPPPVSFCECSVSDSVLVFYDPTEQHPLDQDNVAVSPWIDLKRGGDVGRPGKLLIYDIYAEMPAGNYVFVQINVRWYPSICSATGLVYRTGWRNTNTVFYYGEAPFCNGIGTPNLIDYSGVFETGAEQVQMAWGMLNLCRTEPFGFPCTGVTNTTPWLDNISLGIFGSATAPSVLIETFDFLQDNFAADGTLNPSSTGRLDATNLKNASTPGPGAILNDTLVCSGDGGNTEVRLVFNVRPGPFTNAAALNAWRAQWTPEPSIGSGWYSARMDTAEQGGTRINGAWMATFHESDPGFAGTDRSPDPLDPSQLENEILPDNILTPGSRVDYFLKTRYIPPDPRNIGGTNWFLLPDTSGGNYLEVEILPTSVALDSSWNCTLYVDHHHDRELAAQVLEEAGLTASLGVGGNNKEGTRYDRLDVQAPSSGVFSFGRPIQTNWGASIIQTFAYKSIAWHSGALDATSLTDEDANVVGPWLSLRGIGGNRFWGSGDLLATAMHTSGEPATVNFLRTTLGVLRSCSTVRDPNCPNPSALDSTYCLPVSAVAGSEFVSSLPARIRGNGCPNLRAFDLLNRNSAVATSKGQLNYLKNGVNTNFASVTNHNVIDVDYKTVLDGFGVGQLRSNNGFFLSGCDATGASIARTDNVLDWFATAASCTIPPGLNDVPIGGEPKPPAFRHALGNAYPNPMNPTTRIQFTNGVENGKVSLQIFDVTGRLVKTLVNGTLAAGVHEVVWDGSVDNGSKASNGMYFYKMSAPGFVTSKKLVIMK